MPDSDVLAEPSPAPGASPPAAEPSTTETVPSDATTAPRHVPYERFAEVNGKFRQFEAQATQVARENAELKARIQQFESVARGGAEPASPEYVQAAEALLKIMESNPRLKAMLGLADNAPKLMQGYEGVERLTTTQLQGFVRQGRTQIADLAKSSGLPSDAQSLDLVEELIAGLIRRSPEAQARFRAGDLAVVNETFKTLADGFLASLRRQTAAGLQETKTRLRTLPPAPRGAPAGPPAPEKPQPGKAREFLAKLHERANQLLQEPTG